MRQQVAQEITGSAIPTDGGGEARDVTGSWCRCGESSFLDFRISEVTDRLAHNDNPRESLDLKRWMVMISEKRVRAIAGVLALMVSCALALPLAGGQPGMEAGVWHYQSSENTPFGPAAWFITPEAQLTVTCPPDPDQFGVSVLWLVGTPLAGTQRSGELTDIRLRLDDGRVVTEQWRSIVRVYQVQYGETAVNLLQRLFSASMLSVSADFTDGTTHMTTFDLGMLRETVEQMTPLCARLN